MIFKVIKTLIKYVLKITISTIILLIIYFISTGNTHKLLNLPQVLTNNLKVSNLLQSAQKTGLIKIIPNNNQSFKKQNNISSTLTITPTITKSPQTLTLYYPSKNKPIHISKTIPLTSSNIINHNNQPTLNLFNLPDYTPVKLHINISEPITLHCKVLSSKTSIALGYMYKPNINKYECLIFTFKEPTLTPFYMKNVNFNLDIIFLDKDLNIISIVNNAPSCKQKTCPLYFSPKPYRIVIEMKGNNFKEFSNL